MPKDLYNSREEMGIRTMGHETGEEVGKEKKHVAAVRIGGLLLAGAVLFFAHHVFTVVPAPVAVHKEKPIETGVVSAVNPVPSARDRKPLRDPFAAPPEFRPTAVDVTEKPISPGLTRAYGVAAAGSGVAATGHPVLPVLHGIAGSGGQWAAVLQVGAESRSCRLGERAGPYEVTAITRDSVTLSGPDGTVVLAMER